MTRSQIRTILRRRIHDANAGDWTDSMLNEHLNIAYQRVQLDVMSVNPQAFIAKYRADIVAGQEFYEKPAGCNYEVLFKILGDDGVYAPVDRIDYADAVKRQPDSEGTKYSDYGTHYMLSPTPAENISAGIELDFVPSLSMTSDSDVPRIVHPLHMAIVYHAQLLALGETGEEQKKAADELELLVNKIPAYYLKSGAPDFFQPQIDKRY